MTKKFLAVSGSTLILLALVSCSALPSPALLQGFNSSATTAAATTPTPAGTGVPSATVTPNMEPLAKMAEVVPAAFVADLGGRNRHTGVVGESLYLGSEVSTDANGRTKIFFSDGTTVRMAPSTQLVVNARSKDAVDKWYTKLTMSIGQVWVALQGGSMEVETPIGVAAVRGSYLNIQYFPGPPARLVATCLEGQCQLRPPTSTTSGATAAPPLNFTAGQKAELTIVGNLPQLQQGNMTNEDFNNWIQNNPESVILPLAVTAAATQGVPFTPVPPTPSGGSTLPKTNPALSTWGETGRTEMGVPLLLAGILLGAAAAGYRRWRGRSKRK